MRGYFDIFVIHQTLMWTAASVTCVCGLFARAHTQGILDYSLTPNTFCRVCAEFDSGEILRRVQSLARSEWLYTIHVVTKLGHAHCGS